MLTKHGHKPKGKCPKCKADTYFKTETGKYVCPNCGEVPETAFECSLESNLKER